jgi:hypothetical protein
VRNNRLVDEASGAAGTKSLGVVDMLGRSLTLFPTSALGGYIARRQFRLILDRLLIRSIGQAPNTVRRLSYQ